MSEETRTWQILFGRKCWEKWKCLRLANLGHLFFLGKVLIESYSKAFGGGLFYSVIVGEMGWGKDLQMREMDLITIIFVDTLFFFTCIACHGHCHVLSIVCHPFLGIPW